MVNADASKLEDYLIVAVSSEGTVRNGSGDTIKMELADILRGEYIAPHLSILHYKLDDVSEVAHPETWLKAQPNLGMTVAYETYHPDVERAEKAPAARNDILNHAKTAYSTARSSMKTAQRARSWARTFNG